MKTTRNLMIAGLAALSLGIGTAFAQEGPSMTPANDYWTVQQRGLYGNQAPAVQLQSGSSDVSQGHFGFDSGWVGDHSPYRFDYGNLNPPG